MRLINADDFVAYFENAKNIAVKIPGELGEILCGLYDEVIGEINKRPTVDPLPCKIGDTVWTTKNYWGTLHVKRGVVSEMFYLDDMRLAIVVKDLRRGFWGKDIFPTYEECVAEVERRANGGK